MTDGRAVARLKILVVLVLVMFAALTTRLWYLQVLASEDARHDAENNSVRLVEIPAARGRILDRSGEPLVVSRYSNVLTVNRQVIGEDRDAVLEQLSTLLHTPAAELGRRLDDSTAYQFTPVEITRNVSERVVDYVMERKTHFPGVDFQQLPVRVYP